MTPRVFGLAWPDENGEPDADNVCIWGMELPESAVLYWQDDNGRSQFAVFESVERAAARYGRAFNLVLHRP
ncbi:hypothetical protein A8924_1946 [Saccharopolyspora erythraea NRRL 2338]|uniref:Uncharacterized protein n=2 Tax=Saccharopolyspora erythraea TaxID=1836 RepID=A4F9Z4_SACEN|nr:hypothetical protein [Saccharopolyspora erythraea]EQD85635.1 hypothetical protein N599_13690 [Saccharopolyspora erythraea D]PFG94654.1 hypothetical protein A8924_1946 [Saccharopolyspora erythraea NRRL 2338]QRK91384.1 hypothetical protein JQX30_08300 [Saccharopolyspora erythraea]CAM00869.1 hypothetical protein SACE_1547 [Saccharopolyspora erythraea NRRL 2338]